MVGSDRACFIAIIGAVAGTCIAVDDAVAVTPELPFYENFEPSPDHWNWQAEWYAYDSPGNRTTYIEDPILQPCSYPTENCSDVWGPYKFESWPDEANGGTVYSGQRSGRQPVWDPYWAAILHPFTPPSEPKDLRLKVWQHDFADILCDCDPYANPDPRPNFDVHGWIVLTNPLRTEYFVLGVNSKQSWTHIVWATRTDGWNVTSVPRVNGWRKLQILVHPYQGTDHDVEFLVGDVEAAGQDAGNDVVVAHGRRAPGTGNGIEVEWLKLGGDPALITESILTNTFETFWYDEVELSAEPPTRRCPNPELVVDVDGDGDVDHEDFAEFQGCYTGAGDPGNAFEASACRCMDVDWDSDVDDEDFAVFEACASGPAIQADVACDDGPPAP